MASRVQTAVTMRQVTGSMMNVVKGMDHAMKAMDLEKVSHLVLIHHLEVLSMEKYNMLRT